MPAMEAAKRQEDCFPLPPTPTSMALPRGWDRMRARRAACLAASSKKTSVMGLVLERLYSSRYSFMMVFILSIVAISSYRRSSRSTPKRMKSPKRISRSSNTSSRV